MGSPLINDINIELEGKEVNFEFGLSSSEVHKQFVYRSQPPTAWSNVKNTFPSNCFLPLLHYLSAKQCTNKIVNILKQNATQNNTENTTCEVKLIIQHTKHGELGVWNTLEYYGA